MPKRYALITSLLAALPPALSAKAEANGAALFPAQTSQSNPTDIPNPTIFVAAEVRAKPGVPAPMPIMIGPPKSIPQGAVFLIRGLPPATSFSAGQSLNATTWIIPIAEAPRLTIMLPANSAGVTEITLLLAAYQGVVLSQTKVKLIVSPPTARESKLLKPAGALRAGESARPPEDFSL
jgi:hypothetical protein